MHSFHFCARSGDMVKVYGAPIGETPHGDYRRPGSSEAFRRACSKGPIGSTRRDLTARSGIQEACGIKSESARAEEESQAFGFFLGPRGSWPLERLFLRARPFLRLADQLLIGDPLVYNLADKVAEPVGIAQGQAIVVPEHLLIGIGLQVERLDCNVGSLDRALEQRPEILQSVGVNLPLDVLLGVIHEIM